MIRLASAGVVTIVAALLLAASGNPRATKEGGTSRVAFATGRFNTIDPALGDLPIAKHLLAPACSSLMAFPNKPLPAGFRLAPDLAEAEPVVSKDGSTYTFTVRKDAPLFHRRSGNRPRLPACARAYLHSGDAL